ncbi:MAG: aminoacetone oxidase family FAD-binding enzyme [Lachnospiraceae bacterium]|nr:aminoacetone oxidase family FAD-binding enzyme [Lachnospiraceae bacterium]
MKRIGIIGGGASGLMAAISASEAGAKVTVFEHNNECGRKIKATGNGKCNLTNTFLRSSAYHSSSDKDLNRYFGQFDQEDALMFFRKSGLMMYEKDTYVYPLCNQAYVVRDILLHRCRENGVKILTDHTVNDISLKDSVYTVCANGTGYEFDRVIMACGSYAGINDNDRIDSNDDGYSLSYHLGHSIVKVRPSLVPVNCSDDFCKKLKGVRMNAKVTLTLDDAPAAEEYGEVQFTDYGISGIVVFQLSRYIAMEKERNKLLILDLMPDMSEEELKNFLHFRDITGIYMTAGDFLMGMFNKAVNEVLLDIMKIDPEADHESELSQRLDELASLIKGFTMHPTSVKSYPHAQCCCGGVSLDEIDDSCESLINDGLYYCGEIIDVDGICGGYNLQWAWTTGYIAGRAAASEP